VGNSVRPTHGDVMLQAQVHNTGHAAVFGPTSSWKPLHAIIPNSSWLREDLLLEQVSVLQMHCTLSVEIYSVYSIGANVNRHDVPSFSVK